MTDHPLLILAAVALLVAGIADGKTKRSREVAREFQRLHACPSTGKRTGPCPNYVRDHVVPLCKGGPDTVENMRWQTVEDAKRKDRWECKR